MEGPRGESMLVGLARRINIIHAGAVSNGVQPLEWEQAEPHVMVSATWQTTPMML